MNLSSQSCWQPATERLGKHTQHKTNWPYWKIQNTLKINWRLMNLPDPSSPVRTSCMSVHIPCSTQYNMEQSDNLPSYLLTMCVSLVSQCHLTLVLRSMLLAFVRHASIGSVTFVVFEDPSTSSPQRHLLMLSLHLMLTIVTPCWLGRLGLLPIGFVCAECCSTSHHRHAEVWPRRVWSAPLWATLAGHLSTCSV